MGTKRANSEGSIYQEKGSGLWAATFWLDTPQGSVKKVVRAKLQSDALAKRKAAQQAAASGRSIIASPMTLAEWTTYYLAEVLPGTVGAGSLRTYRERGQYIIDSSLGKMPVAKVEPQHVQTWMNQLQLPQRRAAEGLAVNTCLGIKALLGKVLESAVAFGKAPSNAARGVKPPKAAKTKLDDAMTASEAGAVIRQAQGHRLEALPVLLLTMGLRKGEALDLLWAHVDLDAGTLMVVKSKTASGVRTLELPDFLVAVLKAHRLRQKAERLAAPIWEDRGLVFTDPAGEPIEAREALRWWHSITLAAGVGRRRMHASRHTAATLMLERGIPLEVISQMLGHSSYAITADIYAKVKPQAMRSAAAALADLAVC